MILHMTEKDKQAELPTGWQLSQDLPPSRKELTRLMKIADFLELYAQGGIIMLGKNKVHLPPGTVLINKSQAHYRRSRRGC